MIRAPRLYHLAVGFVLVLAGGCVVLQLPATDDNTSGSGGSIVPPPPPNNPGTVSFSNGSSLGVQLTYHIDQGAPQTIILPAGNTDDVPSVPNCSCFTVDDFTPQRGTLTNGYSFQVCAPVQVSLSNSTGPFVGVNTTISGGGISTGVITFILQNRTTKSFLVFPSTNNVPSTQVTLTPNNQTSFTVSQCQRLQVIVRDEANVVADTSFIESPVLPPGATYAIVDLGTGVQIQKQPG